MPGRSNLFPPKMILAVAGLAVLVDVGCVQIRQTNPPRTVTEQLLISTAADRAIAATPLSVFAHKKVFLDTTFFDSYDSKYAIGAIRDALSQAGALLVGSINASDVIIEARSGALSIDDRSYLVGIPSTGLPIPLAGTFVLPELALYKSGLQHSTAKFALLAYETRSREHLYSSGSMVGKAQDRYYKIVFIGFHKTDIPEKKSMKKPPPGKDHH